MLCPPLLGGIMFLFRVERSIAHISFTITPKSKVKLHRAAGRVSRKLGRSPPASRSP